MVNKDFDEDDFEDDLDVVVFRKRLVKKRKYRFQRIFLESDENEINQNEETVDGD